MALLQVSKLFCRYQQQLAVDHISFTLEKGQILGFLGPNGAGKSSSMNMIAGVQKADGGEVLLEGQPVSAEFPATRQHIGYLPEVPPLYPDMTVREYLLFCAALKQLPKAKQQAALQRVLRQCRLEQVEQQLIGQLSKGYRQRVGIAQAIIHQPVLIILDEPTVGLDPLQIQAIRELIKSLAEDHAIILSTHILAEVESVCTHVQIMHQGRLLYQSSMDQFTHKAPFVYHLKTSRAIKLEQWQPPAGIEQFSQLDSCHYRFELAQGFDALERLFQQFCAQHISITELCPQQQKLENVFVRLIRGE